MMGIRGRTASWVGGAARRGVGDHFMGLAATAVAGGALVGGVSALTDPEGPWGSVQEVAFGDRDALRSMAKAQISHTLSDTGEDIYGRGDYYYGQSVSTGKGGPMPVMGDIVFGMNNLRRAPW